MSSQIFRTRAIRVVSVHDYVVWIPTQHQTNRNHDQASLCGWSHEDQPRDVLLGIYSDQALETVTEALKLSVSRDDTRPYFYREESKSALICFSVLKDVLVPSLQRSFRQRLHRHWLRLILHELLQRVKDVRPDVLDGCHWHLLEAPQDSRDRVPLRPLNDPEQDMRLIGQRQLGHLYQVIDETGLDQCAEHRRPRRVWLSGVVHDEGDQGFKDPI